MGIEESATEGAGLPAAQLGSQGGGGDLWSFANVAAQLFCRRLGGWGWAQGRGLGFNEENEALGLGWQFSEVLEVL